MQNQLQNENFFVEGILSYRNIELKKNLQQFEA